MRLPHSQRRQSQRGALRNDDSTRSDCEIKRLKADNCKIERLKADSDARLEAAREQHASDVEWDVERLNLAQKVQARLEAEHEQTITALWDSHLSTVIQDFCNDLTETSDNTVEYRKSVNRLAGVSSSWKWAHLVCLGSDDPKKLLSPDTAKAVFRQREDSTVRREVFDFLKDLGNHLRHGGANARDTRRYLLDNFKSPHLLVLF